MSETTSPEHEIRSISFEISGEDFQVRTDLPEESLQEIAQYVESKIQLQIPPGTRGDKHKKLVLIAMEIAGELFENRKQLAEAKNRIQVLENLQNISSERIQSMLHQFEDQE